MRRSLTEFLCPCLFACLVGCNGFHVRPENVPRSTIWVDHTFIECTVEAKSKANRCTVYKDDSGEVLAEGLFRLAKYQAAAQPPELRYQAFGDGVIYLQDARVLVQWTASERDPSRGIVSGRLKTLAGTQAIDCSSVRTPEQTDDSAECAVRAFTAHNAFYVSHYDQYAEWFDLTGVAGDSAGNVYELRYFPGRSSITGPPGKAEQWFDNKHTWVVPCPKPVTLDRTGNGTVICVRWTF